MVADNRAVQPVENGDKDGAKKLVDDAEDTSARGVRAGGGAGLGMTDVDDDDDDGSAEGFVDELKPGTLLFHGQFKIVEFINSGGFGITYLAKDSLDRRVVIKECFPGSFCRRSASIVRARSRAHQHEFRSIVRLFVQEARSLSKLIHPNIVGVHQVFEDNDTAYMAIDYIDGRDLLAIIEDKSVKLTPTQIVGYLTRLLEAVEFVHQSGVLHRDISPDNILIDRSGEPILIDFGAAREQASKASRALSALRVVKDGYSPQEFYVTGSLQSESSDLYALAASFYHVITGFPPPNSQARLAALADQSAADPYVALAKRHKGYPGGFLEAIDKAMSVLPRDRIKSARAWLELLQSGADAVDVRVPDRLAAIDSAITEMVTAAAAAEKVVEVVKPEPEPEPAPPPVAKKFTLDDDEPEVLAEPEPEEPEPEELEADDPESEPEIEVAVAPDRENHRLDWAEGAASAVTGGRSGGKAVLVTLGAAAVVAVAVGYFVLKGGDDALSSGPDATPVTAETSAEIAIASTGAAIEPTSSTGEASTATPAVPEAEVVTPGGDAGSEPAANTETAAVAPVSSEDPVAATSEPEPQGDVDAASGEAAPSAVGAQGVWENQFSATYWEVSVPFESEIVVTGERSFPVITTVQPAAMEARENAWMRPGVTIYAVNEEWVASEDDIKALIARDAEIGSDNLLGASVRIRSTESGPFEHVSIAVPAVRWVSLANGVVFKSEQTGTTWKTSVIEVPDETKDSLHVGDVLISERETGQSLNSSMSLEAIVELLARRQASEGKFAVSRDGSIALAVMALAQE